MRAIVPECVRDITLLFYCILNFYIRYLLSKLIFLYLVSIRNAVRSDNKKLELCDEETSLLNKKRFDSEDEDLSDIIDVIQSSKHDIRLRARLSRHNI